MHLRGAVRAGAAYLERVPSGLGAGADHHVEGELLGDEDRPQPDEPGERERPGAYHRAQPFVQQFQVPGRRQQRLPADDVVADERLVRVHAVVEHLFVTAAACRRSDGGRDGGGRDGGGRDPVALPGERVRGHGDAPGRLVAGQRLPRHVGAGEVGTGQVAECARNGYRRTDGRIRTSPRGDLLVQVPRTGGHECGADSEVGAAGGQRVRDVPPLVVPSPHVQPRGEPVQPLGERGRGLRGHRAEPGLTGLLSRPQRRCRRLAQHRVHVGTAEPERADCAESLRPAVGLPRACLRVDVERTVGERDVPVGRDEVQRRHQHAVLETQQRLQQAGDAGDGQRVAEVGLDGADRTVPAPLCEPAEDLGEGLHLDRVAEPGAGAVALHVPDPARVDAEPLVHGQHQCGLRRRAGCGEAIGPAVLVGAGRGDDAVDGVAIAHRVGQALEHHDAYALARHEAVRAVVEGPAPAARREHARLAGEDMQLGRIQGGYSPGQGQVGAPVAQRLASEVHSHQRGGAGGVHGEAGAVQVEMVREPRSQYRRVRAHERVPLDRHTGGVQQLLVVAGRGADECVALRAVQHPVRVPCVLQRPPCLHEVQPLLRVHQACLAGRDAEEVWVELVDVRQHGAPFAVGLAGRARVRIPVPRDVPPLGRDLPYRVRACEQVRPQFVEVAGLREPAGHADDGDVLRSGRRWRGSGAVRRPGSGLERRPHLRGRRGSRCGRRGSRCGRRGSRCGRRGSRCGRRLRDVVGELAQVRVVEEVGRLQLDAEVLVDPVHNGHGEHRIHAEVGMRDVEPELFRRYLEDPGHGIDDGPVRAVPVKGGPCTAERSRRRHGRRFLVGPGGSLHGFLVGPGGSLRGPVSGCGGLCRRPCRYGGIVRRTGLWQPVPFAGERVCGQRDATCRAVAGVGECGPVGTGDPELSQLAEVTPGAEGSQERLARGTVEQCVQRADLPGHLPRVHAVGRLSRTEGVQLAREIRGVAGHHA